MSNKTSTPWGRAVTAYRQLVLPATPRFRARPEPRRRIPYLTPKQVDELVIAYRQGASVYELAERFGVNRRTVSKHLKQREVQMNSGRLYAKDIARVLELRGADYSPAAIAGEIGRPELLVWRALKGADATVVPPQP